MTPGASLMNQIHEGSVTKVTTKYLLQVKTKVTEAIEELLDVGARIRPLILNKERVGWVRGVYPVERQLLRHWFDSEKDLLEHTVSLGTSLTKDQIDGLGLADIRSILRVIQAMTDSDLSLYPYMSAFSTTSASESLWFSSGQRIAGSKDTVIPIPDGSQMKLLTSSDHARLWASLCNYRESNKRQIDASMNAVLIIRPWVGQGANSLTNDLKESLRALSADVDDAWTDIVSTRAVVDLEDGWAHGGDDSVEAIKRELDGMLSNDRHEQFMAEFNKSQKAAFEARTKKAENIYGDRIEGVSSSAPEVLTAQEVHKRIIELTSGRSPNLVQTDFGSKDDGLSKLDKYS